jgi:carnitine O-acetyltransferase
MYALYCLLQRQVSGNLNPSPDDPAPRLASSTMPALFTDPGWTVLNTAILSTSNCGNPALRLFGFGPVAADGYGIGYIIKEDGISVQVRSRFLTVSVFAKVLFGSNRCASSKHLQTRRYLDTLQGYLHDIQRLLIQLHREANERPAPFVDHAGVLRDSKTGRPINGYTAQDGEDDDGNTVCESQLLSFAAITYLCMNHSRVLVL